MHDIDKDILKELNSFEVCELTKFLETVELHEYYASGYKNINGGFASTEVTDIVGDYDEETEDDVDLVIFRLESGVQDMGDGHASSDSSLYRISREVINNKEMSIKEKMAKIEGA